MSDTFQPHQRLILSLDSLPNWEEGRKVVQRFSRKVGYFSVNLGIALPVGLKNIVRCVLTNGGQTILDLRHTGEVLPADVLADLLRESQAAGVFVSCCPTLEFGPGEVRGDYIRLLVEELKRQGEDRPKVIGDPIDARRFIKSAVQTRWLGLDGVVVCHHSVRFLVTERITWGMRPSDFLVVSEIDTPVKESEEVGFTSLRDVSFNLRKYNYAPAI